MQNSVYFCIMSGLKFQRLSGKMTAHCPKKLESYRWYDENKHRPVPFTQIQFAIDTSIIVIVYQLSGLALRSFLFEMLISLCNIDLKKDVTFTYYNHSINHESTHRPYIFKMLRPKSDHLVLEALKAYLWRNATPPPPTLFCNVFYIPLEWGVVFLWIHFTPGYLCKLSWFSRRYYELSLLLLSSLGKLCGLS